MAVKAPEKKAVKGAADTSADRILRDRAYKVVSALEERYPDALCSLEHCGDPWKLLVMARLSAQTTDAQVNIVSVGLFEAYPDVYSMAAADVSDVERLVHSCGFFRTKARNIVDFSRIIVEKHGGSVPSSFDDLLALPGVGRKIANLIRGDVFGLPAVVADTHCIRIANRLGLSRSTDQYKTELALAELIPEEKQSDFCHRIVLFGREICDAKKPKCDICPVCGVCPSRGGDKPEKR